VGVDRLEYVLYVGVRIVTSDVRRSNEMPECGSDEYHEKGDEFNHGGKCNACGYEWSEVIE